VSADVQFVGGPEAAQDLRRWASELAPAVAKAGEGFAARVADQVRGRVPVLTGRLAGSVEIAPVEEDALGAQIGEGVPYAGWIEFGGSRGRPFIPEGRYLYPTALDNQDEFASMAADAASETVARFSWSMPPT